MPDQEVLINDSNLNAIANAIRRKNGLVRTYKPREMAPAIRAINADAPDSREYTVTVIQTPHQTIKVRQVLGGEKQYDQSFTVSEPYWKIQATIEAEAGYTAGALNYPNEVTVDRDITIKATPATIQTFDDPVDVYWYVKDNSRENLGGYPMGSWSWSFVNAPAYKFVFVHNSEEYTYENVVRRQPHARPFKRVHMIDMNDRRTLYMNYLFHNSNTNDLMRLEGAVEVIQNMNTSGVKEISYALNDAPFLERIDISNFDVSSAESMVDFIIGCPNLKSIGNISHWNPESLISCSNFMGGITSRYITSLDVSGWNTPKLENASNFVGGNIVVLDISNWDTTNLKSFSFTNKMEYLIMDKEEVKFSGDLKCYHPNNTMKYLVPLSMVNDYKQHPNWSAWANQIDSVTNYTINRGGGKVIVVPNY